MGVNISLIVLPSVKKHFKKVLCIVSQYGLSTIQDVDNTIILNLRCFRNVTHLCYHMETVELVIVAPCLMN